MNLKLNLKNRIVMFAMINEINQNSLTNWNIINQAKTVLGLTEEENKEFGVESVNDGKGFTWKLGASEEEREYEVPGAAVDMIKDILRKADTQETLTADQAALAAVLLAE